jgi:hypothetical protein
MSKDTAPVRALNDELRQQLFGGRTVMTPGIAALSKGAIKRLVETLAAFDAFDGDNDPYDEHDSGAFNFEGQRVMFKIDYYAKGMQAASLDPADPTVTERVITIMLAEEY